MTTPVEPASAELIAEIEGVETLAEGSAPTDHIIVVAGVLAYVFALLRTVEAKNRRLRFPFGVGITEITASPAWSDPMMDHLTARATLAETANAELTSKLHHAIDARMTAEEAAEAEIERLREDKERMDWLETKIVEVRKPMVYGSHNMFFAVPDSSYEGEDGPSDIRKRVDRARAVTAEMTNEELTSKPREFGS